MSKYKSIIYDCDGVMFDSFEANFAFYQKIMNYMGRGALDRKDSRLMEVLHTYSSQEVFAYLFSDTTLQSKALSYAKSIDYLEFIPFMKMEDELINTLETLKISMELAVCTNRAKSMLAVLERFKLDKYFSLVMTSSKVENPKPHPDSLLAILDHYNIKPAEALFIGDADVDKRAAEAASVPFVSYKTNISNFANINNHYEIIQLLE